MIYDATICRTARQSTSSFFLPSAAMAVSCSVQCKLFFLYARRTQCDFRQAATDFLQLRRHYICKQNNDQIVVWIANDRALEAVNSAAVADFFVAIHLSDEPAEAIG